MKVPKDYKKVTVIGSGIIGHCWAVVFARGGLYVSLYNRKSKTYDTALNRVKKALQFLADEGVISDAEVDESMSRVHLTDNLQEAVRDTDYIQECLWEDLELKQDMFLKLTDMTAKDIAI
jgi:3-hydroxyacyl-CoA dehydrogenase